MTNKRQFTIQDTRAVGTKLGHDWTKIELEQFRRGLQVELEQSVIDPETKVTNGNLVLEKTLSDRERIEHGKPDRMSPLPKNYFE